MTPEPAPIVADAPLPASESALADVVAPEATTETAPVVATTRSNLARTTRSTKATANPAARTPVATTTRKVASAATTPAVHAPAARTAETLPTADPAMVAPLPEPVAAAPVAQSTDSVSDDMLPIAGAAGLGILAFAGAAFAMRRRRRTDDDVMVDEPVHEPVVRRPAPVQAAAVQPIAAAPVAALAFKWGIEPAADSRSVNRIESAKRGPTPDNPSLSLKKRLKRAAFFDQRDRQMAVGMGTPVPATAGLPNAMAIIPAPTEPVSRPEPEFGTSFGRTFQPA